MYTQQAGAKMENIFILSVSQVSEMATQAEDFAEK